VLTAAAYILFFLVSTDVVKLQPASHSTASCAPLAQVVSAAMAPIAAAGNWSYSVRPHSSSSSEQGLQGVILPPYPWQADDLRSFLEGGIGVGTLFRRAVEACESLRAGQLKYTLLIVLFVTVVLGMFALAKDPCQDMFELFLGYRKDSRPANAVFVFSVMQHIVLVAALAASLGAASIVCFMIGMPARGLFSAVLGAVGVFVAYALVVLFWATHLLSCVIGPPVINFAVKRYHTCVQSLQSLSQSLKRLLHYMLRWTSTFASATISDSLFGSLGNARANVYGSSL
jgi:hypothetical protein